MKIYLDTCCLNRPFDDQTQDKIRLESEAVLLILTHFESGEWEWIGSEALDFEIEQIPDHERKIRIQLLTALAARYVHVDQAEIIRAQQLAALRLHTLDALHIACAESGKADIFLTTDEQLFRQASRLSDQMRIRVDNPLTWLKGILTP